jgi:2-methylcitrate dehydratase PrpD
MNGRQSESVSHSIARYVSRAGARFPEKLKHFAKEHLLDGFATMTGGATQDASRHIDRYLQTLSSKAEATVIGTGIKLTAQHAALANGIRGHVLDYDDVQLATLPSRPFGQLTHPTTPVMAAALAVAEKINATGLELLQAYIVGMEVACRLADAIDPRHYLNGFHPTGTIGVFGATAACAHLLKLKPIQTSRALGIAATLASGVRAHRGTMAKSLNAGHAAENGVVAATLAHGGFTASTDVFDDPMGYFSAACGNTVERRLIKLGRPHFLIRPGIAIKKYPCAAVLHPALDAIIELSRRHDIQPGQVRKICVGLDPDAALPLVYERPATGLEGKFSLPFSAAVALARRQAGLGEFTDATARDPAIVRLMRKVELQRMPKLKSSGNLGSQAKIEISLDDGRSYRRRAIIATGHPKKPLARADLEDKFRECAAELISPKTAAMFIERLWSVEKIRSLGPWLRLLRPAPRLRPSK